MRSTLCEQMILINLFVDMFVKSSGFSYFFCFSTTNYRLCFKSYFNSMINIEWKPLLQYWLPVAKSADVLLVAHIFPSSTSYWAFVFIKLTKWKINGKLDWNAEEKIRFCSCCTNTKRHHLAFCGNDVRYSHWLYAWIIQ